jgi:hypothetical protein
MNWKLGNTLLLIVFVFLSVIGMKMVAKVADPYTRKISPSLADALGSV